MFSCGRIWAIANKEIKQLFRDRMSFWMIVGIPLIQILLFGYAINLDVRNLRAAVADHSSSQLSRALIDDMRASQIINIIQDAKDSYELKQLIDKGKISVGIFIPWDFERRLIDNHRGAVQLMIDGSDPTIARVVKGFSNMKFPDSLTRSMAESRLFEMRTYYNTENRSAVFVVPAISGIILQMTMVLFTAIAIVRERERGNLELLISTPISNGELMIGKIFPYVIIGLIQASIIFLTGLLLFDVIVQGSLVDLYLSTLLFIAAVLSLGLVISTIAKSQFQAMEMSMFILMPSILLSGYMFPFDGMPKVARWLGNMLPVKHFISLIRGIVLRGTPISELTEQVLALCGFLILFLALAIARFKKQLD